MTKFEKLVVYFEKFPGVGTRQAKRFAFHILTMKPEQVAEFSDLISSLSSSVVECKFCHRFFTTTNHIKSLCHICDDMNRDGYKLMVVANDNDIQAIERSDIYNGLFFVFGGTLPLLTKDDSQKGLRSQTLKKLVLERTKNNKLEIILGFAVNPDGENTSRFIENLLSEFILEGKVKITHLGRGLSTGSEIEYADVETIKNALKNRI